MSSIFIPVYTMLTIYITITSMDTFVFTSNQITTTK